MRIFGRQSNTAETKRSASDRTSEETETVDLSRTEEMPIVREIAAPAYPTIEPTIGTDGADDGDSDVFVCASAGRRRSYPDLEVAALVTLFVYGWENVQPGPLSWVFPSLRAALDAVRTMRNAIEWCIVAGNEWTTIDAARAKGAILIEQNA